MEKLNMKYDRLKEILDTCDLSELDSIEILLGHVKSYDLKLMNNAVNSVYQQKWDKDRGEFEGINEYDYITRISNFDISKIFTSNELNSYELIFFKKIMKDALINIINDKNPLEIELGSKIVKALKNVNDCLNDLSDISELSDKNVLDAYDDHDELNSEENEENEDYKEYEDYDKYVNDLDTLYESNEKITKEELENMFTKFNVIEIEEFEKIYEHITTYNIEKLMKISNKVKNQKINNAFKKFEVSVRPNNFNIASLYCKKDKLSEKELKLLCILLKDVTLNYEGNDDFKTSLSNLMESYMEELIKRKETSEKTIDNQNVKEKSSSSSKRNLFLENIKVSPEELANNKKCLKEEQEKEKKDQRENGKKDSSSLDR